MNVTHTHTHRGKRSFDQSGVGAEVPAEVKKEDDEFELYRKRMMLAYRFRPNPLVIICNNNNVIIIPCFSNRSNRGFKIVSNHATFCD